MSLIRNARADEAVELAGIGIRAWARAISAWMDPERLWGTAENAFLTFTSNHFISIDVLEVGGQAAGWAAREKLDNKITDLWVDPIFQHKGYGTRLLAVQEQEIADQGYDMVAIETSSQNGSVLKFLENRGYRIGWMTATWSDKLDRDVDTVGLRKVLAKTRGDGTYGMQG
jgi:ribosomal-protein-alanine N-acetyltransferase